MIEAINGSRLSRLLELAIQLNWNHYNGRRMLQMELLDWRTV